MKRALRENYHAHAWNEPVLMEMGNKGERGLLVPQAEDEIQAAVGDVLEQLPVKMRRQCPPQLPELSQPQVLRHYLHLSQMCLGADVNIDIGLGTCTMKYSPKVNEELAKLPQMADLHPLQDEETVQGILEIMFKFGEILKEISGLDEVSFQPGSGAQAIYTNACIMRAYHEARGEGKQRNEIITTIFSHPANAATPATAGFKVITLMPDKNGVPDLNALKAAVSERTAGLMITNPEDTGIYNPKIREYVNLIHEAGGLCSYDQANANVLLGICRAREAGFDLGHFNLHKTFSSPHGCMGPGCGAVVAKKELGKFFPVPVLEFDGEKYRWNYDRPESIGKMRGFIGNAQVVLKAYAWVMSLGAEGLRLVSETAAMNNSYLVDRVTQIPGTSLPYGKDQRRLDQARYSWEKLQHETGVGTDDFNRRLIDFGVQKYWESHHPRIIAEPFTLEPAESYSKDDIDEYVEILKQVSKEAYTSPELVKSAPHRASIKRMAEEVLGDPQKYAMTWRAFLKKRASW